MIREATQHETCYYMRTDARHDIARGDSMYIQESRR